MTETGETAQVVKPGPTSAASAGTETMMKSQVKKPIGLYLIMSGVIILAGVGTGYALAQLLPRSSTTTSTTGVVAEVNPEALKVGQTYGAENGDKFPDEVEGILVKGGIEGEGSHHLIRPGGKSQTVYLTSSVLDLDNFVGTKVTIKGETFQAQKAGWLMDAGQVKVVELNVENPEAAEAETLPEE